MYYLRDNCRLCISKELEILIKLGNLPVADKYFKTKDEKSEYDKLCPSDLYACKNCGHVQLLCVIEPKYLWDNYHFKTSKKMENNNHYDIFVDDLFKFIKNFKINKSLDIGSNDGFLMEKLKSRNITTFGIDPSKEMTEIAKSKNLNSICDFFSFKKSQEIKKKIGTFELITANNVFAHVDDLKDFAKGVFNLLNKDGLFLAEISYLPPILKNSALLGTIFHEHLSYHSLTPLISFLEKLNMEIIHVTESSLQGGSVVCYIVKKNSIHKKNTSIQRLVHEEKQMKITNFESLKKFEKNLDENKNKLKKIINDLKKENRSIFGFGSSVSSCTLMNYFDISQDIEFLIDDNPKKQYKFSPQFRIPILPSKKLEENQKSFGVLFAWEHNEKLIKKFEKFITKDSGFITIMPEVKLYRQN